MNTGERRTSMEFDPNLDFSMGLYDALLAKDRPDLTLEDARRALTTLSYALAAEAAMTMEDLLDSAKGTPYAGL